MKRFYRLFSVSAVLITMNSSMAWGKVEKVEMDEVQNHALILKAALSGYKAHEVPFDSVRKAIAALEMDGVKGLPDINAQNAKGFEVADCGSTAQIVDTGTGDVLSTFEIPEDGIPGDLLTYKINKCGVRPKDVRVKIVPEAAK